MVGEDVGEDVHDENLGGGDWLNLDLEGGVEEGDSNFTMGGDGSREMERESGPERTIPAVSKVGFDLRRLQLWHSERVVREGRRVVANRSEEKETLPLTGSRSTVRLLEKGDLILFAILDIFNE